MHARSPEPDLRMARWSTVAGIFGGLLLIAGCVGADITRYEECYLRCIAGCVAGGSPLQGCEKDCARYERIDFCGAKDEECWAVCKDLGPLSSLPAVKDLHTVYLNGSRSVQWTDSPGASLYAVQYRPMGGTFEEDKAMLVINSSLENVSLPTGNFCDPFGIRVAAVAKNAISPFSTDTEVEAPKPSVSPLLKMVSIKYSPEPFISDFYQSNGTLLLTLEYDDRGWPLGISDLSVTPMFTLVNCQIPDFSQGVPEAEFARLGADQMFRQCRYVYYVQTATSNECGTEADYLTPPANALQTLYINCTTVEGSPCADTQLIPGPVCGQVTAEDTLLRVLTPPSQVSSDLTAPLTVNVSFVPIVRQNEPPTLYYIGMWGEAQSYDTEDQKAFLGVNQTNILGQTTNCGDNTPPCEGGTWMIVDDIHLDNLYGLTICAIKNMQNLTLPPISGDKANKPRALSIFVPQQPYIHSRAPLVIGLVVSAALIVLIGIFVFCCCRMRRIRSENHAYQMKLREMELHKESRYTDFPKKCDIWEIDRRNVDVYHQSKLGQGAFGAVYLGKLIGKSLGHHDANSPLGVNLMRTENCEVAIKTLPESADDESKEEFLREIQLMKLIGYHERLVNMLACVTETEPLLLVVEYCSEGDLLHYLRERCKYMMKLDALGIDYTQPKEEDDINLEMIVTMKQLLMFSVQISYGLEYLSQKGFVHRDVAARNVLVHKGNECKIGDFGLCRQLEKEETNYKSRGGRLPLKWMSPEAIRDYDFSTKSDVWAFGVLLFEVITLGGSPYPEWKASEVLPNLERGERMPQPDNCPDEIYSLMRSCWNGEPSSRPDFSLLRQKLAVMLEEVTEEYSYLKLDSQRNYYNVQYEEDQKIDVPATKLPMKLTGHANPAFSIDVGKRKTSN